MEIRNLKQIKENLKSLITNIDKNIDSLYKIATHDEKTGLYNYKFFSEMLKIELEKAKRGNKLSIAIFDIDFFKQINTKYGHIKADELLIKVAKLLESSLRISDIIARFGGEEFIALLPNTSKQQAKLVAERLRKLVEKQLSKYSLTISSGITEYKSKDTIKTIKTRADKALFKAKEKGRNKVEVL